MSSHLDRTRSWLKYFECRISARTHLKQLAGKMKHTCIEKQPITGQNNQWPSTTGVREKDRPVIDGLLYQL